MTMERFDLVSLVKGVIQSASILAQQKEAKILFEEEEPVYVWADEFKVEEVVTKLYRQCTQSPGGRQGHRCQTDPEAGECDPHDCLQYGRTDSGRGSG